MADLFDRRRMFLTGLAVFTLGSLVSGLAGSPLMLILARGAQGAGAAMLTPAAMSIVMTTYAGRQRATALGLWGTVASMGIAAGVLFGGILTTALDWRAVFFINVPVGAAVLAGVLHRVPAMPARPPGPRRLDLSGALTLVTGLLALVYAVESTTSHGWTAPVRSPPPRPRPSSWPRSRSTSARSPPRSSRPRRGGSGRWSPPRS